MGGAKPEVNRGQRAGQTSEESEVVRKLRRENAELKRANFIFSRRRVGQCDQGVCVVDGVFEVPRRAARSWPWRWVIWLRRRSFSSSSSRMRWWARLSRFRRDASLAGLGCPAFSGLLILRALRF